MTKNVYKYVLLSNFYSPHYNSNVLYHFDTQYQAYFVISSTYLKLKSSFLLLRDFGFQYKP